ncbi:hypothetical protein L915_01956, partial [Phytophthora nicotianae]
MAALRTINIRAALHEYTPLSPLRPNATRWSATFEMVAGYDLRVFQCVTLKLQLEDLALAPTKVKLSATAPIVLCPTFEAAAVGQLPSCERKAIKHVEMSAAPAISGSKSKQLDDKGVQEDFATS